MIYANPTKKVGWFLLFPVTVRVRGWGRPPVELFPSDGWNSCLYNIPKIAYIVFSTFLGECAAYVLKYWESFISTINLRKNGDTFYFSCRWEIPDNQVLLTKSWQQAAAHFSRKGDNGGKMAQAVSYFFPLIPSPIKHAGLWEIWFMDRNASPTLAKKKWFITLNSWEGATKTQTFLLFQNHKITLLPLLPSSIGRTATVHFPPKVPPRFHDETESKFCLHFNYNMCSLVTAFYQEYICVDPWCSLKKLHEGLILLNPAIDPNTSSITQLQPSSFCQAIFTGSSLALLDPHVPIK